MKKQLSIDTGMFTMDFINEVDACKNFDTQKNMVLHRIHDSRATTANKEKVKKIVEESKHSADLIFSIYNVWQAHSGNAVVKTVKR